MEIQDIKIGVRVKNKVTDEYATIKAVNGDKVLTGFTVRYDGTDKYTYYPLHERDWFAVVVHHMMLDAGDDTPAPTPAPMGALPHDSAERKTFPIMTAFIDYFPSAVAALANHSYVSNEKHNPGMPVHWSRDKSGDHLDAAARHLLERDYHGLAWRAMAALQMHLEAQGHPVAPAAR